MTLVYMISAFVVLGLHFVSALPQSKLVAKADSGSGCSKFTLEQAKELPGWPKFKQYAKDHYGGGEMDIVFNHPLYPDRPALICLDENPIPIIANGNPNCPPSVTGQIGGTIIGTNGTAMLSYVEGYSNSGTWTVIQESSFAVGETFKATFGIPGLDFETGLSQETKFTNSLSKSFTTMINHQQTQTVTISIPDGKHCVTTMTTRSCDASGNGEARYKLSGFVWFIYVHSRPPKNDPNGEKHYHWNGNIAEVLGSDELISSMKFSGTMQMSTKSDFAANCS